MFLSTINKLILGLVLFSFFISCKKNAPEKYSFFVAGHAYGSPSGEDIGLHPPFVEIFPLLNQNIDLAFGFLTGDIVRFSWEAYWKAVQKELGQLNCQIHLAPGNHDIGNRELFDKYYDETFYSFEHGNDLFIILDGNKSNWNIEGKQFAFLKSELSNKATKASHTFIFIHQLIWWKENTEYGECKPNSFMGMSVTLNFHQEILPLFYALEKPVYLLAGDVGVFTNGCSVFYHKTKNVSLIASGMGNNRTDNYLMVNVLENGEVDIKIIGLNCDSGNECMGKIEDY